MQLQPGLESKTKEAKSKIDSLQSELNNSELLMNSFQTGGEKIKTSEEELEEKYEKLRKTNEIEKDSIIHKLSHCNLELEKKIKRINPSYRVYVS